MSAIDRIREIRRQSNGLPIPYSSSGPKYSDPHGRDKVRLGQEMERDLGHYSFNTSIADSNGSPRRVIPDDHTHDYSMDYKGGDTDTGNSDDFFPRSPAPSTNDLNRHFRDFSMNGIDTSLESVEMPRGPGKEMGTPELDMKDFDRPAYSLRKPLVNDHDLSSQLQSPSSHGRSASLSDFGEIKRSFSPVEQYGKSGLKPFPSELDKELKTSSTPQVKQHLPERPRSAFMDRYAKPSPPFQRPRNPIAKTIEQDCAKPAVSTLPRSFKDSTQLLNDLGIQTGTEMNSNERDTMTRNQSFRLPDMTGIHSLINTSPKATKTKIPREPKYPRLESIPVPKEEEHIISGLRSLQDKVNSLTSENTRQRTRVRELENELRSQRALYNAEKARADDAENQMLRRSSRDSGFGSVGDSDEALERHKALHARETMSQIQLRQQLENQLVTLRSKITLLEARLEAERDRARKLEEERDDAIRGMTKAINECDGMRSENKALKAEIVNLKKQIQDHGRHNHKQTAKTAKDRFKDDVETRRDLARMTRVNRETQGETNRSFIQPGEVEELRREIRALRDAKGKPVTTSDPKANVVSSQTLDQTTKDTRGNVQTIRIQLENATDHKGKNGTGSKQRRIRRVIVESDLSSSDHSDADNENDATSDSNDEDYTDVEHSKSKNSLPIQPWLRPPGQAKSFAKSEIQNIIDGLAKHNADSCTVCSRKRRLKGKKDDAFSRKPLDELNMNDITEPLYEGVSIRPSVPPKQALSSVLDQLKDEFHHLQLQYRNLTSQYEGLDPGRGKRKRKAIAAKLRDILEEFEAKADQIYALYDVVEGARLDVMGGGQSRKGWLEL